MGIIGTPYTYAAVARRWAYMVDHRDCFGHIGVQVEVHDKVAHNDQGGLIPPTLVLPCPRCGKMLRIDGYKKQVSIEYLNPPRPLPESIRESFPPTARQTCLVTVPESNLCPYDHDGAACGTRFKIERNTIIKL